jgi:hypothetical protein
MDTKNDNLIKNVKCKNAGIFNKCTEMRMIQKVQSPHNLINSVTDPDPYFFLLRNDEKLEM